MQHLGEHTSKWWEIICRDAVTGNVIDGTLYGVAKRWWGTASKQQSGMCTFYTYHFALH